VLPQPPESSPAAGASWLLLAEGHLTRRVFAAALGRIWALPLPGDSGPGRERSPLFMVLARLYGDPLAKSRSKSGRLLYTTESWEAKMDIPDCDRCQIQGPGAE